MSNAPATSGIIDVFNNARYAGEDKEFVACLLSHDHCDQLEELEQQVLAHLKTKNKEHFFFPKTKEEYSQLMDQGHEFVGIFHHGKLVAKANLIYGTDLKDEGLDPHFISYYDISPGAAFTGAVVHPGYTGCRLQTYLIDFRMQRAEAASKNKGFKDLFSITNVDNPGSTISLLKKGFRIKGMGIDERDGALVFNLHKPLSNDRLLNGFQSHPAIDQRSWPILVDLNAVAALNTKTIRQVKTLLDIGYQCHGISDDRRHLLFNPPEAA